MIQLPAQHPRAVGCYLQFPALPTLSSFLAQTYWPCLALPLGKPVTSVWPWNAASPGNYALSRGGNQDEKGGWAQMA